MMSFSKNPGLYQKPRPFIRNPVHFQKPRPFSENPPFFRKPGFSRALEYAKIKHTFISFKNIYFFFKELQQFN